MRWRSESPSPCPGGDYVFDSVSQFNSGAITLYKEVPTASWVIGKTTYTISNTTSSLTASCPHPKDPGFELSGHLTSPRTEGWKAASMTICFDTDAGPGTSGSFENDITAEAGGNTSMTITTATAEDSLLMK
jgi:hypothetical protein